MLQPATLEQIKRFALSPELADILGGPGGRQIIGSEYFGDDGDDDDESGDDDDEIAHVLGDVMGVSPSAARRVMMARRRKRGRAKPRMAYPGVQHVGERRQPLPLGTVTFINGGATTLTSSVNAQRPFRGKRLSIDRQNVGAASPGLSVFLSDFRVGNVPQPALAGNLSIASFAPTAVDSWVDLDSSVPGVTYFISLTISAAPAVGETVTVSVTLFGDTLM